MFHRAHLLFYDCPLLKRKSFLSRATSYDKVMEVISSKTLLVANQPNYYHVLLFHPLAFLLFAVVHQNDFLLFQYFQHWIVHVINLQQQNIIFPFNKCQVEEKKNWHAMEIMIPRSIWNFRNIAKKMLAWVIWLFPWRTCATWHILVISKWHSIAYSIISMPNGWKFSTSNLYNNCLIYIFCSFKPVQAG